MYVILLRNKNVGQQGVDFVKYEIGDFVSKPVTGICKIENILYLNPQDEKNDKLYYLMKTSVYKGYKQDKIEMRGDRAEMSDFPLYLNTVAGGLDRRDQTIGGFSFVVKIYAVPVVEIIG